MASFLVCFLITGCLLGVMAEKKAIRIKLFDVTAWPVMCLLPTVAQKKADLLAGL